MLEELLTPQEVAGILKVSQSAVFKWAKKGVLPSYRIHEKCLRFKKEDIAAFVEKGKGAGLTYKKNEQR